jgi:hypothetical protein
MNKILLIFAIFLAAGAAWGVYGFGERPIRFFKYLPAFVGIYFFQVLAVVLVTLVAVAFLFKPYRIFAPRCSQVNAYVELLKRQGVDADNLTGITGLMRACYALNKPFPTGTEERSIVDEVINRYIAVYSNLPASAKSIPTMASNNLNFHLVSQVYLFNIKSIGQYIYIITHDARLKNKSVEVLEYDSMPAVSDIKKLVGEEMPESRIRECLSVLQDWALYKRGIHGSSGYGQTGGTIEDDKHWLYGYFPVPMSSINYKLFLADALQLGPLLDSQPAPAKLTK